ncbi:MAG: phenylacetate--CoA ligase family protein [Clostridiales bacterium]|nr:phenylacetate--CoA ligase family protein [Clostridiales bacterium]
MYGLSRKELDEYIKRRLRETVKYAGRNSTFYKERLAGFEDQDDSRGEDFIEWFKTIPFTDPAELKARELDFLCVRPSEISRIVTLNTGGTTGNPKRIYFTEEDQQLTVSFFERGMQWIVGKGDRVLILMPARITGSIGLLLAEGLNGFGAKGISYGLPKMDDDGEAEKLLSLIADEKVGCVVAIPTHMKGLADANERRRKGERVKLDSVLLSAEYVSAEIAGRVAKSFDCKVYEHYGMTEMGLGCAVSCGKGRGYHIREKDLYLEIIDPETGEIIKDDRMGEIVFTTLTRKGMPFIRYRTGDKSRWILGDCPCGSVLKRIERVGDRGEIKGYLKGEKCYG